jgi:hypothetical protein
MLPTEDPPMTDRYSSLSLATLKEISAGVDRTLGIFERRRDPLGSSEMEVKAILQKLQGHLAALIGRHPDNR